MIPGSIEKVFIPDNDGNRTRVSSLGYCREKELRVTNGYLALNKWCMVRLDFKQKSNIPIASFISSVPEDYDCKTLFPEEYILVGEWHYGNDIRLNKLSEYYNPGDAPNIIFIGDSREQRYLVTPKNVQKNNVSWPKIFKLLPQNDHARVIITTQPNVVLEQIIKRDFKPVLMEPLK